MPTHHGGVTTDRVGAVPQYRRGVMLSQRLRHTSGGRTVMRTHAMWRSPAHRRPRQRCRRSLCLQARKRVVDPYHRCHLLVIMMANAGRLAPTASHRHAPLVRRHLLGTGGRPTPGIRRHMMPACGPRRTRPEMGRIDGPSVTTQPIVGMRRAMVRSHSLYPRFKLLVWALPHGRILALHGNMVPLHGTRGTLCLPTTHIRCPMMANQCRPHLHPMV